MLLSNESEGLNIDLRNSRIVCLASQCTENNQVVYRHLINYIVDIIPYLLCYFPNAKELKFPEQFFSHHVCLYMHAHLFMQTYIHKDTPPHMYQCLSTHICM